MPALAMGRNNPSAFEAMMARKTCLPQGMAVQIPWLGKRAQPFCRMDPRHALRQQAIQSTHFSSLAISGMIAGEEREQHRCRP
jgi:hypothetical protein